MYKFPPPYRIMAEESPKKSYRWVLTVIVIAATCIAMFGKATAHHTVSTFDPHAIDPSQLDKLKELYDLEYNAEHPALIQIEITSTRSMTVSADVYIDGKFYMTYNNITPGSTFHNVNDYKYTSSTTGKSMSVSVTLKGSSQVQDSKTITTYADGKYTVRLYV
ncbi:hypothetical protein Mpt1_c04150 [Candidatus Methanoplasma termitum]|uniref:Uncharacterized protein n=2 Tax=Candidatus Methanoplasma termitum TaxID=1577791 RepID=A0A0A7LB60_9ARCH|nr:hypothetical protein Mpt1_c04150 [Candidatus Methanoplasma termitum]